MLFGAGGIFSELGYLWRLVGYERLGRFLGGLGGSSSSLLNVKSITCPIDLLAPPDVVTAERSPGDPVDTVELISPAVAESRGILVISRRSSSSSPFACSSFRFGEALASAVWNSPLGSIMT